MRQSVLALLGALAFVVLLFHSLPLAMDDPLRSTLALLPAVVAALLAIGSWAQRHGGRSTPAGVAFAESTCLALLVLAALARPGLGLRYADVLPAGLIAAGLAILLAHRVGRIVISLRPSLGKQLTDSPGAPFFLLPLVVYLAILPWATAHRAPDGDEPYNLLVAHSLAYDFDADLTNNYATGDSLAFVARRLEPQVGDPVGPNGELYSRHNLALPLVLAPAYRLGGKLGALSIMAMIAALTAWMTLRVAGRYFHEYPGGALLAWALFAFTPPFLLYSYQVWTEVPAILLTLVALDRILELRSGRPVAPRDWLVLLLILALLPLIKLRYVVVSAGLLLLSFASLPRIRRSLVIAGVCLVLLAIGVLAFNALVFDNPLKHRSWQVLRLPLSSLPGHLAGASGILYDSAFGLFAVSPIWLLLWPAAVVVLRRHRQLALDFALLFGLYLPFVTGNHTWYGAWSPPMRYALLVLPLASVALIPLLDRRRAAGARFLLAGLGSLTLLLTVLWTVVPGWTYNMADGRSLLLDHLSSILEADAARFFASSIRPRLASWIWPPVSALVVTALWWWPRRPRRGAMLAGVALTLLLLPALSIAARRTPTRIIEFEDPWIARDGGSLHPPRWTVSRHRYRGSWQLSAGHRISVPLVGQEAEMAVELDLRVLRVTGEGVVLTVGTEEETLARWDVKATGNWQTVSFDSLDLSRGQSVVIGLEQSSPGAAGVVLLDRARLRR